MRVIKGAIGIMLVLFLASACEGAFSQSSDADGIVSMEAEHFMANVANGDHSWVTDEAGSAVQAMPNTGANLDTGYASNSPRLDFQVNFVKTGPHYIWARGIGATPSADSFHAGLDGAELASCDRISGFGPSSTWSRDTMDGSVATFDIATVGVHTVNVWMREDGFLLDKIVITSNPNYVPSGRGPAESPKTGGTTSPQVDGTRLDGGVQPDQGTQQDGAGPCVPTTCLKAGAKCGGLADGCGAYVSCGSCSGQETCGGSGVANQCGVPTFTGGTWVIDSRMGDDSGSGHADAPWRTWGKLILALNDATIQPGERVLIRPGRYAACEGQPWFESLKGPGGIASAPITIAIDPGELGDVEIHGSVAAGTCGSTQWAPAKKCTSGSFQNAVCDSDTDCPGGGTGSCTTIPNVYFTTVARSHDTDWRGAAPGVAFQPSLSPVGGAPKIFEILYSDKMGVNDPVKVPAFTSGHDQYWPYPIDQASECKADKVPWFCCTGAGTGDCGLPRGYVQTASGAKPDTVGNVQYGEVELPTFAVLWQGLSSSAPTGHIRFTNHLDGHDTGRTFYFWWGLSNIILLGNGHDFLFEDFDIAYNSRVRPWQGGGYGTTFPRNAGGETHLIYTMNRNASYGPNNAVHDITFRNGKIHGSQGNEMIHSTSGPVDSFYGLTFDHVEFADGPWAVPNGSVSTSGTGNANTGQVSKSWPPPNYPEWSATYATHWSPLGGGGMSSGAMIIGTPDNIVRNCYFHDVGLISFHEDGEATGTIFENNVVDLGLLKYSDMSAWSAGGVQMAGFHPNLPVSQCDDGPDECHGYAGQLGVAFSSLNAYPNKNGTIVRNNIFVNVYGQGLVFDIASNGPSAAANAPATPHMIVNNTFIIKGDPDYMPQSRNSIVPVSVMDNWATSSARGIIKNNIFYRETTSATGSAMFWISAESLANTDIDYNNWGGANVGWLVGADQRASFADFKQLVQAGGAVNEAHSLNTDPQFVQPFADLHLQNSSPSYETGSDLSAVGWSPFSYDHECDVSSVATCTLRPVGQWSMGAYQ
jgi:hypothetical protein